AYEVDHAPLFRALPSGHRHAAVVHLTDGTSTDALLYAGADLLSVAAPGEPAVIEPAESRPTVALRYVWLGITHILEGADHVVFLLGLLLIGGKLRHILAMVTAFTISHSITLALAVTGALAPSPSYVEPLIALSVAYVGVENFIVKDASKRWRITALFGLVHGFGFAGALAEVGIPKEHVPLALATFNVGVEMGQLMIIGLAYPVFSYLRKVEWIEKRGVRFASAAVVVAGLFWFVARVLPSS
ncbi:MAG TPA: HupE/UreJ family protein, partial [Polyangiaceae bacterium]|nr:HupE/UreJ family protein [Polyangiaceae bacterium]